MGKDINFIIRKKILVPSRRQLIHMWRSDWKQVAKINHIEAAQLFNFFNPNATIVSDSQFAKLIFDKFGDGIYSVIYYKTGTGGFRSLLKFECHSDHWMRLPRHQTKEEIDNIKLCLEVRRLKKVVNSPIPEEERRNAQEELNNIVEEKDFNKEILTLTKKQSGPSPYLVPTMPLFRPHEYEDYNVIPTKVVETMQQRIEKRELRQENKEVIKKEDIIKKEDKQQEYNEIW